MAETYSLSPKLEGARQVPKKKIENSAFYSFDTSLCVHIYIYIHIYMYIYPSIYIYDIFVYLVASWLLRVSTYSLDTIISLLKNIGLFFRI